jgi:hypothetical protein
VQKQDLKAFSSKKLETCQMYRLLICSMYWGQLFRMNQIDFGKNIARLHPHNKLNLSQIVQLNAIKN